jgi:hypothetical protein
MYDFHVRRLLPRADKPHVFDCAAAPEKVSLHT